MKNYSHLQMHAGKIITKVIDNEKHNRDNGVHRQQATHGSKTRESGIELGKKSLRWGDPKQEPLPVASRKLFIPDECLDAQAKRESEMIREQQKTGLPAMCGHHMPTQANALKQC